MDSSDLAFLSCGQKEAAMKRAGRYRGYLLAMALGAVVGGVAVVLAMRAMPRRMAGMMRRMMEGMGTGEM